MVDIGKNCEEQFERVKAQIEILFRFSEDEELLSNPATLSTDIKDISQQITDAYNKLVQKLEDKGIPVGGCFDLEKLREDLLSPKADAAENSVHSEALEETADAMQGFAPINSSGEPADLINCEAKAQNP